MRRLTILTLTCTAITAPLSANAQVAGATLVGVAAAELRDVAAGWGAKRHVLGRPVYNDQGKPEHIGKIDDIIISPDKAVSCVIINAGGFIGAFKHDDTTDRSQRVTRCRVGSPISRNNRAIAPILRLFTVYLSYTRRTISASAASIS